MYNLSLHKQCALPLMCTLFSASSSSLKYVNTGKNMGPLNTCIWMSSIYSIYITWMLYSPHMKRAHTHTHTHTHSLQSCQVRALTYITSCVPVPSLHKNYSGNNKEKSILWNIEGCKLCFGVIVFSVQTVQKADKVNWSMCVWRREDSSREMNTQMVLWCLTGTCYFVLFHLPPTHLHTENPVSFRFCHTGGFKMNSNIPSC